MTRRTGTRRRRRLVVREGVRERRTKGVRTRRRLRGRLRYGWM
jgi:hypothetical protein